jgi:hypothetical protein
MRRGVRWTCFAAVDGVRIDPEQFREQSGMGIAGPGFGTLF